jgi:hypothetical protein
MSSTWLEPAIPAIEFLLAYAYDPAATGIVFKTVCYARACVCVWTMTCIKLFVLNPNYFELSKLKVYNTRDAMYAKRNTDAHSRNHCGRRKAISISYFECVFVALDIQHEKRMRRITICGLSRSTTLCHITSYTIFEIKKLLNMKCGFISSTTSVWNTSLSTKNWARYDKAFMLFFK